MPSIGDYVASEMHQIMASNSHQDMFHKKASPENVENIEEKHEESSKAAGLNDIISLLIKSSETLDELGLSKASAKALSVVMGLVKSGEEDSPEYSTVVTVEEDNMEEIEEEIEEELDDWFDKDVDIDIDIEEPKEFSFESLLKTEPEEKEGEEYIIGKTFEESAEEGLEREIEKVNNEIDLYLSKYSEELPTTEENLREVEEDLEEELQKTLPGAEVNVFKDEEPKGSDEDFEEED
jgi:hypothetical protein